MKIRFRYYKGLHVVAAAVLLSGVVAHAAENGDVEQKRSDLEDVRRRIRDLQKEIADTEESRSSAASELAEAERAVSRMQRELQQLGDERAAAEKALAQLEADRLAVEQRVSGRQKELSEWLRRHYVRGGAGSVAPFLSTGDPNQLARDAYYLEQLGKAHLELIDTLRADLRSKAQLGETIAARRDRLATLEAEQRARRDELEAVKEKRRRAVVGLADQLRSQRTEVQGLRQDQERLGQLVAVLVKRAAEREAARAAAAAAAAKAARAEAARLEAARVEAARADAARAEAAKRAALRASRAEVAKAIPPKIEPSKPEAPKVEVVKPELSKPESARAETAPRRDEARATAPREAVVGEVRQSAGPTPSGVSFAQLRGRMKFPARGELVGRFGAPRAEGGTAWRGVFIRAAGGAEVRAVASGEVVFSDWLRGYGNLIILDHGGDYLTIYGNNDALLKVVGDNIAGGETIARVGASGSDGQSGLYFEIRYRGQPLDPLKWVQLN
ncbi:murein hydrolase activator EnvC family protein [Aromatoleum sp.]|uniref:murein hydrolase activator EnvC family protein n=1 Tax=Aromatoleum sp. TaxID=2307007 RepID=UPI0039C8B6DD